MKRKARTLLLPYFGVGIFYIIIDWLIHGNSVLWNGMLGVFIRTTESLPIESALWFLVALFWVCCLYCLIEKYIESKWKRFFLISCITIIGCKWTNYFHFLPWGINSAMSAMGFFALGRWFRVNGEQKIEGYFNTHKNSFIRRCLVLIVLFVSVGLLIMVNDKVNMRVGNFGIVVLSYFAATSYCMLLLLLVKWLQGVKKINISVLSSIGRNSIIYMCVNHLMLNISKGVLNLGELVSNTAISIVLEFVLAMGLMAIVVNIVKKTFLRYMFSL